MPFRKKILEVSNTFSNGELLYKNIYLIPLKIGSPTPLTAGVCKSQILPIPIKNPTMTPGQFYVKITLTMLCKKIGERSIMGESGKPGIISTSWFEGKLFNLVELFIIKMEL